MKLSDIDFTFAFPRFVYRLICQRRGHDVFTVMMKDASGNSVDVLEGCLRGCGWSQILVEIDDVVTEPDER